MEAKSAHMRRTKAVPNICADMRLSTKRDGVWNVALSLAARGRFTAGDVEEALSGSVARRTILDCLKTMETQGWLQSNDRGRDGLEFWLSASVTLRDGRDSVFLPGAISARDEDKTRKEGA